MREEYIDGFGLGTKCVAEGIIDMLENKGVFDVYINGMPVVFREDIIREAFKIYNKRVDQLRRYTIDEVIDKVYEDRPGFVVIKNNDE